jgi:hypothetical protein
VGFQLGQLDQTSDSLDVGPNCALKTSHILSFQSSEVQNEKIVNCQYVRCWPCWCNENFDLCDFYLSDRLAHNLSNAKKYSQNFELWDTRKNQQSPKIA